MGPSGRFTHVMIYWTVWDRFIHVLYLGRAPRTKETLPDFLKWRRVTRHPLVFCGLTSSQRTPEFGVSQGRGYYEVCNLRKRNLRVEVTVKYAVYFRDWLELLRVNQVILIFKRCVFMYLITYFTNLRSVCIVIVLCKILHL